MKKIIPLLILGFTIQFCSGQSCGIYKIKYIGKIKPSSLKIEKIKLPSISYLHGLAEEKSEGSFIEVKTVNNKINIELTSRLTSHLSKKPEDKLNLYKSKRKFIPITVTGIENGKTKERRIELTWDNIQIRKLDNKFVKLFELNLNEINIEK